MDSPRRVSEEKASGSAWMQGSGMGGGGSCGQGKRQEAFPIVKIKAADGNEDEEEMLGVLKIGNV